jgi:hypothetical protein
MSFIIKYGTKDNNYDVSVYAREKLTRNNITKIPSKDANRIKLFGDISGNEVKYIFLTIGDTDFQYNALMTIYIDNSSKTVSTVSDNDIDNELLAIHNNITIDNGILAQNIEMQKMAVRYLTGSEKILELGAGVGMLSLTMGYILAKSNNVDYLASECNTSSFEKLVINRDANNMKFKACQCTLSDRKMIQQKWIDGDSKIIQTFIKTAIWDELIKEYNIDFDTLVFDNEGGFLYILTDMRDKLSNVNLIILKNDFSRIRDKVNCTNMLLASNFYLDYNEGGGIGPSADDFYQVWKKSKE